jgi:hypothetical protein
MERLELVVGDVMIEARSWKMQEVGWDGGMQVVSGTPCLP